MMGMKQEGLLLAAALGIGVTLFPGVSPGTGVEEAAAGPEADAVWSQSDGIRQEIYYSTYAAGVWSDPVKVTDDYYDNMYPVVDRDRDGRLWLFWSAYDNKRMELRYTVVKNGDVEESKTLETGKRYNSAPSMVIAPDNELWVVWAANDGTDDDDIYSLRRSDNVWGSPQLVHADNETPDTLPVVELNAENEPVVSWQHMENGEYVTLQSVWDGSSWQEPAIVDQSSDGTRDAPEEDMIPMPSFLNKSSLVFFRIY